MSMFIYLLNMSLRHLYIDLNILGIYPDLLVSIDINPSGGHKIHPGNKYYGARVWYNHMIFNTKVVASIMDGWAYTHSVELRIGSNSCIITMNVDPMIVRFNKDVREVKRGHCPFNLDERILMRYREVKDMDSLCKVIEDIVS